jgi:myo-inositol-1(or 4)-monophosphatase
MTEIVREAGREALGYFRSDRIGTREKGERDVVTAADFAVESLLRRRLQDAFPGDGIIGEEGSEVAGRGRRWYLDPVDGTLNFSRGLPVWCVSMGLFDGDGPLLGAICDPVRNEVFAAARGLGASRNGAPVNVSSVETLEQALVHLTVDFREESRVAGLEDLRRLVPQVLRTRNVGSAALALAYLAAGHFDAMVHRHASTWDYAAGVLLVREAGGVVTDIAGGPFDESTTTLLAAASRTLHGELLRLLGADRKAAAE